MKVVKPDISIKERLREMQMDKSFLDAFLNSDFLVIEEKDDKIIGVAGPGGFFHVGVIFVKKEFRGSGIGSKLNLMRDKVLRERNYSFFIGTTYTTNPNAKEISNILKERNARPVFAFSFSDSFVTTIYIQEFNWKGKIIGKLLEFFNTKFGTFYLAAILKTTRRFWNTMIVSDPSNYPKIDILFSVKNFHKVHT